MKKGWSTFMDRRVKERLVGATILVVLIVLIVPELLSGPRRPVPASPSAAASAAEAVRNVTVDLATSKATPAAEAPALAAPSSSAGAPSTVPAVPDEAAPVATSGMGMPGDGSPRAPPPGGSSSSEPETAAGHRAAAPPTITTLQAQQPVTQALENDVSSPKSARVMPKSGAPREPVSSASSHHSWVVQLGSFASSVNAETLEHRLKGQNFSAYISSSGAGRSLRYRVRVGPMADRAAAEKVVARLRKEGHSASVVAP
jgi:DedD protein